MKTKPFDLEAAKNGAKVVTRDGRPARIICTDAKSKGRDADLIVLVEQDKETDIVVRLFRNGCYNIGSLIEDRYDLFLVDETESELTEFDKAVCNLVERAKNGCIDSLGAIEESMQLYDIARKELQKESKPAEWSEEDKDMLNSIVATCQLAAKDSDSGPARHLLEMQERFLNSLRPQPHWNPSEEQMKELEKIIKYQLACGLHASAGLLQELIDDLRKLL